MLALGAFLFFLAGAALVAEFRAFAQGSAAFYTRHGSCRGDFHFAAAFTAEFCARRIRFSANRAADRCRLLLLSLLAAYTSAKSVCHLAAHGKAGAQARAKSRAAALILRRIAQRVGRLELHIALSVAQSAHRRAFVYRCLDLFRKRNIFDVKLTDLDAEGFEIFIDLAAQGRAEF